MARIRSIKPEFWEDENVGLLSPHARLLFIATWNLADDEGLLRWSTAYIKASVFMYDDLDLDRIKAIMGEVVDQRMLFPYLGGKARQELAWIPNFRRHQKINRPQPGKLPAPSLQNMQVALRYAERDGWVCHLCQEAIPQVWSADQRLNLSLDHLIPRSKGGTDYPSNIAAAHLTCNKGRGARLIDPVVPDSLTDSRNDSVNDSVSDAPLDVLTDSLPDSLPEGKGREQGSGKGKTIVEQARPIDDVVLVFQTWQASTGKQRAKLDGNRRYAIQAALDRYGVEDVLDAVQGWANDPWPERAQQNDIVQLLWMGSRRKPQNVLEKMRDLWRDGPPRQVSKQAAKAMQTSSRMRAMREEVTGRDHDLGQVGPDRPATQRALPASAD